AMRNTHSISNQQLRILYLISRACFIRNTFVLKLKFFQVEIKNRVEPVQHSYSFYKQDVIAMALLHMNLLMRSDYIAMLGCLGNEHPVEKGKTPLFARIRFKSGKHTI